MSADVNAAMDALGARLATIAGLRVYDYPSDTIQVPAAVVSFPTVTYDSTYARGADTLEFEVTVLVGRVVERAARDALGEYMVGDGGKSVKAAVDGNLNGAAHSARVTGAEARTVSVNSVDYWAAAFTIEVIQ